MTIEATWDSALPDLRAGLVRRARRLGVDAETAQDLTQEALYEAWRLRDRVYDPSGTEKWLAAIFRNVYLRHLRRHGRDQTRPDPVTADTDSFDTFDIEVELERRELAELLDRALALLPAQTRDVLVHRFVQELPVGEVAARLGLSAGAVQMRLQRGKLAMRRTLVTQYGDDARELPGVRAALVAPAGEQGLEESVRVHCADLDGSPARVADSLAAAGVPVRSMTAAEPTLEDVFIALTNQRIE